MCSNCKPAVSLEVACRAHLPMLEWDVWNKVFRGEHGREWRADIYGNNAYSHIDRSWSYPIGAWVDVGPHPHNLQISQDDIRQVAYSPDGVAPDDHKRRRRLSLGRYLTRQWNVTITPDIERGINAILADIAGESSIGEEFEILRGRAVTDAYVASVGCSSCMVGEDQERITEWFSHFPEKIGLVVWDENKGRALLWTLDDGRQVLDRIYAGNHSLAKMRYAAWCKANGVASAYENGLVDVDCLSCDTLRVTLGPTAVDGRMVPYLDTFRHANDKGEFFNQEQRGTSYCFTCTEGYFSEHAGTACADCGDRYDEDDMTDVGGSDEYHYVCEYCRGNYSYCEHCESYCSNDDTTMVRCSSTRGYMFEQIWCDDCASNNASSCHCCGETWRDSNTIQHNGETVCESCVENGAAPCCEHCDAECWPDDLTSIQDENGDDVPCCCECCDDLEQEIEERREAMAAADPVLPAPGIAPNQIALPL